MPGRVIVTPIETRAVRPLGNDRIADVLCNDLEFGIDTSVGELQGSFGIRLVVTEHLGSHGNGEARTEQHGCA